PPARLAQPLSEREASNLIDNLNQTPGRVISETVNVHGRVKHLRAARTEAAAAAGRIGKSTHSRRVRYHPCMPNRSHFNAGHISVNALRKSGREHSSRAHVPPDAPVR